MPVDEIQFFVRGLPIAQGSKTPWGTESNAKRLKPWRQEIMDGAKREAGDEQLLGPLRLRAVFYFPRPSAHFGTGRNKGLLKESAPKWRDSNPDLDKLLRSLCDALTQSGVIRDDRQFVWVECQKLYAKDPGVLCNVQALQSAFVVGGDRVLEL